MYVGCKGVSGAVVRMAVADAVVQEEDVLWRYRWRKDVLDSVIYAQGFFGNVIGYDEAEKIMDGRLEERKHELAWKCANARMRKCGNEKPSPGRGRPYEEIDGLYT